MSREKAIAHFKIHDPVLYEAALPYYQTCPAHLHHEQNDIKLFETLCRSIIGQQLSTKAAETIRMRLYTMCDGMVTPQKIISLTDEQMLLLGVSRTKTRSIKELATSVIQKNIVLSKLRDMEEGRAHSELCHIYGIGPWTADMFLMFALGRNDVFSPHDLGLLLGIKHIDNLSKKPTKEYVLSRSKAWKPYRTWAALFLWKIKDTKVD